MAIVIGGVAFLLVSLVAVGGGKLKLSGVAILWDNRSADLLLKNEFHLCVVCVLGGGAPLDGGLGGGIRYCKRRAQSLYDGRHKRYETPNAHELRTTPLTKINQTTLPSVLIHQQHPHTLLTRM